MKKLIVSLFALFFIYTSFAQDNPDKDYGSLPAVEVKTLDGTFFNTGDIENDGKPIILSFWATYCKPCIKELSSIAELYDDWQDETGVMLIAVSIDKSDRIGTVKSKVYGGGWEFPVYLDQNGDLKRAMNVNNVPHTFILDGDKKVVWQHTSYADGGEYEYIEIVEKLISNESISE